VNGYFLRKLPRLSCQGKALACPLDFSGYPDHDRVPGKSHSLWRRRAAETSLPPREKVPSANGTVVLLGAQIELVRDGNC